MRLCLDEHYSPQIAAKLRDLGYDVASVKERPELVSLGDAALLSVMAAERRALLTGNVQDFNPIVQQIAVAGDQHYGLVYSSPESMPRSRGTIALFVKALRLLLDRFRADDDFVNRLEWLSPPER